MTFNNTSDRDLILLEHIEQDPHATQATMASQLGVAVGTVNWHLKRLISKGYVKIQRATRRKLLYIITPEGMALRARLTIDYIENSFNLYRLVRKRSLEALTRLKEAGCRHVHIIGDGEIAEICRLSCLEEEIEVLEGEGKPALHIEGLKVLLELEDEQ